MINSFTKASGENSLQPHHQCTYWEAIARLHKAHMVSPHTASVLAIMFGRSTDQILRDLEKGSP